MVKAFFTDNGHNGANQALQLWGGYGYVHDYGIEQTVRDSRIAMIYEGTNEIQALDLLQRNVLDDGGARLEVLLATLEEEEARCASDPRLADFATALRDQVASVRKATRELVSGRSGDPEWPQSVAGDYLRGLGFALLAWAWARSARSIPTPTDDVWYRDKLQAARFGLQWLLPEGDLCWRRVLARDALVPSAAE
jgi:hypothetical protein